MTALEPSIGRVLLLEPNAGLRSAIQMLLEAERYDVQPIDTLGEALSRSHVAEPTVALVAWQTMQGLLAEEHRHDLVEMNRRLPLLVMVPARWARLLESTDMPAAVTKLIAKPFESDVLLNCVRSALELQATVRDQTEGGVLKNASARGHSVGETRASAMRLNDNT